jgi:hypothetical protein
LFFKDVSQPKLNHKAFECQDTDNTTARSVWFFDHFDFFIVSEE